MLLYDWLQAGYENVICSKDPKANVLMMTLLAVAKHQPASRHQPSIFEYGENASCQRGFPGMVPDSETGSINVYI